MSLLLSPIISKITSVLAVILLVATIWFSIAFYREKAAHNADKVTLQAQEERVNALEATNKENIEQAVRMEKENNLSRDIAAQAIANQQTINLSTQERAQGYEIAKKEPEVKSWVDTPLPDSIKRMFSEPPSATNNKNSNSSGPATSRNPLPKDKSSNAAK